MLSPRGSSRQFMAVCTQNRPQNIPVSAELEQERSASDIRVCCMQWQKTKQFNSGDTISAANCTWSMGNTPKMDMGQAVRYPKFIGWFMSQQWQYNAVQKCKSPGGRRILSHQRIHLKESTTNQGNFTISSYPILAVWESFNHPSWHLHSGHHGQPRQWRHPWHARRHARHRHARRHPRWHARRHARRHARHRRHAGAQWRHGWHPRTSQALVYQWSHWGDV